MIRGASPSCFHLGKRKSFQTQKMLFFLTISWPLASSPRLNVRHLYCRHPNFVLYPWQGAGNMTQSETISLKISPEQKGTIDLAAESCGKSRTAFIVESAFDRAQNMLLDRTRFILDGAQWDAFTAALYAPADVSAMRKTLEITPPWDEA